MIDELKEALAAHPENPFLQGHVSALENMPNCRNCDHCKGDAGKHPVSGLMLIRCEHPSIMEDGVLYEAIDPTFGEMCADHSRENVQAVAPPTLDSALPKDVPGG